ncbi:MAG: ferrous iron transport protein A [Chlorobiaceae bacterium]|nr:ferrous iron transport protein A [Chlorobiaceae bacterium]
MKLSDLQVGDRAEVTALKSESAVRRRIMDMGLIKGTSFKVLRVAPLGDPIEIFFKGLYLALRKTEAEGVLVRKVAEPVELVEHQESTPPFWRFGGKA